MDRPLQSLNFNWIRSFEAAARHLSFTEAARELHMTQAGVSHQIRNLENHLDERLFHRLPRSLQLTDAGEAFLNVVRESLDRLSDGMSEIFTTQQSGALTVRVNVAFAVHWLAPRLAEFRRVHPDLPLRLIASVHGVDTTWDGVDLEIRYGANTAAGFASEPIFDDTLSPVCAPSLLEGPDRLRVPSDLRRFTLIHIIGNRLGWADWFRAAGLRRFEPHQTLQTDTSALALALAEAGVGVALGHAALVADELARGRLVAPFETALPIKGVFHLVHPRERNLRPEAALLREWLLARSRRTRRAAA